MTSWTINEPLLKKRIFPDLELITEKILFARGIKTQEQRQSFFLPDYEKNLHNPFLLEDMEKAIQRIKRAFQKKEIVCIFGDYDADGVTASVLLKNVLDDLKIKNFYYIPDRNKEGYGLNLDALTYIKNQKASLIITVDSGISSEKETKKAQELNLDVIITDHHHPPEKLPQAIAVINPKKKTDRYPFKDLAGVGVAFKLAQALYQTFPQLKNQQQKWLLDLVALGTIADCVPLVGENRILTRYGLIVLAKTKRVGFRQLFSVGKIAINGDCSLTSEQVAFQLAPRINAAGRMDHANTACALLSCSYDKEAEARILALEVEDQNQRRQKVTRQIMEEIESRILKEKIPDLIIESSPHWEMGVVGLVAGKIAEKYQRPTFVLQEKEDIFRGSGRSAGGFNLILALGKNAALLEKYGGHSQAAGLVVKKEKLDLLKENLKKNIEAEGILDWSKKVFVDAKILPEEINEKLLRELAFLEPFGEGNRPPLFFMEGAQIVEQRTLGKENKHLKIWIKKGTERLEGIGFGLGKKKIDSVTGKANILFYLEEDNWNGRRKIQLRILDLEMIEDK